MMFERLIGGEMEIVAADLDGPQAVGAWPSFGKGQSVRCDTGRSALQLALLDWKCRHPTDGVVWVPSYTCPSVTSAIMGLGLSMRRYDDRPGLGVWSDPPTPVAHDIVIIIHYFGILNRAAVGWVDSVFARNWDLIEDCVQAPYTAAAGVRGEYVVTSLRKWWSAPDGAQVCTNHVLAARSLSAPDEQFVSQRVAAKLLRAQRIAEASYLEMIEESERSLEAREIRRVSWISGHLLQRADAQRAGRVRRANWSALAAGIAGLTQVQPLFAGLEPGEVPLAFPIIVAGSRRDELRHFLMSSGIFCPIHWSLPPDAPRAARELSERILSIPLDQRYRARDMDRVIATVGGFFNGSRT